jgi:hypothetical protein
LSKGDICRIAVASDEADRRRSDGNEVEGCNLNANGRLRDSRTVTQSLCIYMVLKGTEELLKSATTLAGHKLFGIGMSGRKEDVIEAIWRGVMAS